MHRIDIATMLHILGWVSLPLTLLPALYLMFYTTKSLDGFCRECVTLIDDINYAVGESMKWLLPILVMTVAFSVFALSIFGLSWTKLFESAEYINAGIVMLGAALTLLAGKHVRVDVFQSRMSPKDRALVDFMGFYALLLPTCLVLIWTSQTFVAFSWRIFEGSAESDGLQGVFLLKTLIPLFAIMMIAQGLSITLRAAMVLRAQPLPKRPKHISPLFMDEGETHGQRDPNTTDTDSGNTTGTPQNLTETYRS